MVTTSQYRLLVTGASSGLGRATAILFASQGARIICADLQPTTLAQELNTTHGSSTAIFVKCDVTHEPSIQNLIAEAVKFGNGRIDILCNYAGVAVETNEGNGMTKRAHEMSTEDFDFEMSVNLRGTFLCCKYALGQMLEGQEARSVEENRRGERTRGWIVNAASMLGESECIPSIRTLASKTDISTSTWPISHHPFPQAQSPNNQPLLLQGLIAHPNTPAYTTSKHAVVGLTKQLALDYAGDKVHVNCPAPASSDPP